MEFALVALILLSLIVGVIQFAIFFWSFQVGSHAALEGARRYSVDPCNGSANNATTRSRVGDAAEGGSGAVRVTASFSGGSPPETGDEVTVTVRFPVHQLAGSLIPTPDEVTKAATARVEDVEDC